jgi:hypothetical protein
MSSKPRSPRELLQIVLEDHDSRWQSTSYISSALVDEIRASLAVETSAEPATDCSKLGSDEPLVVAIGAVQKYADEYVDEYELAGDSGDYTPSDHQRLLIADAINGLIADEDFLRLVRTEVVEREKRRGALGECLECSRLLPDHWGGCSALKTNGDPT